MLTAQSHLLTQVAPSAETKPKRTDTVLRKSRSQRALDMMERKAAEFLSKREAVKVFHRERLGRQVDRSKLIDDTMAYAEQNAAIKEVQRKADWGARRKAAKLPSVSKQRWRELSNLTMRLPFDMNKALYTIIELNKDAFFADTGHPLTLSGVVREILSSWLKERGVLDDGGVYCPPNVFQKNAQPPKINRQQPTQQTTQTKETGESK